MCVAYIFPLLLFHFHFRGAAAQAAQTPLLITTVDGTSNMGDGRHERVGLSGKSNLADDGLGCDVGI